MAEKKSLTDIRISELEERCREIEKNTERRFDLLEREFFILLRQSEITEKKAEKPWWKFWSKN